MSALAVLAAPSLCLHNGVPTTTSRDVASYFGKRHDNVMRDVSSLLYHLAGGTKGLLKSEDTPSRFFSEEKTLDPQNGQTYPIYRMTKDGFTLLAMGYTGRKALQFKLAYIEAFNRMEQQLRQTPTDGKALLDDLLSNHSRWALYEYNGALCLKPLVGCVINPDDRMSVTTFLSEYLRYDQIGEAVQVLLKRLLPKTFRQATD